MREISPAVNVSSDEFFRSLNGEIQKLVEKIRMEKTEQSRLKPSSSLIDKSELMTAAERKMLLDKVAELVDENLTGRSDMCRQFADLLQRALTYLAFSSELR
jgi:hypothetical protein